MENGLRSRWDPNVAAASATKSNSAHHRLLGWVARLSSTLSDHLKAELDRVDIP